MGEFDGKVVFITGIARGQGRNHALRFAREGASIIGIDIAKPVTEYATYEQATEDDFHETVRSVEEAGGKIVARIGDVRDSAALKAVVDEGVAQFGSSTSSSPMPASAHGAASGRCPTTSSKSSSTSISRACSRPSRLRHPR